MKEERKNMENPEKSAPVLFSIPKNQVFEVPDNYFEKLPLKIQERVRPKKYPLSEYILDIILKPQAVISTLLTMILIVFGVNYFNSSQKTIQNKIAVSETERIPAKNPEEEKLPENMNSMKNKEVQSGMIARRDDNLVEEKIQEETIIIDQEIFSEKEKLASNDIPQGDKINYLLDNDIDVSLILEELQKN